jgi:hypothetical protein
VRPQRVTFVLFPASRFRASLFFSGLVRKVQSVRVLYFVPESVVPCTQRGRPPRVLARLVWVQDFRRRVQRVQEAAREGQLAVRVSAMFRAE